MEEGGMERGGMAREKGGGRMEGGGGMVGLWDGGKGREGDGRRRDEG